MSRLPGLDIARFLAFAGMVVVNFNVAAHAVPDATSGFVALFEGRAAALFVVLAGVGISLARLDRRILLLRGAVLFAAGLLNMLIFPADILHYYGAYFAIAALVLTAPDKWLVGLAIGVVAVAYVALFALNYEAGWNFEALEYPEFWTPTGFIRNLFYNGWHPVFPWISFVLVGMWLGRRDLASRAIQHKMIGYGAAVACVGVLSSWGLSALDSELAEVVGTSPLPPTPFYILGGIGSASFVLGLCLRLIGSSEGRLSKALSLTGRQALTLYMAHILFGLVTLDLIGWLDATRPAAHLLAASVGFTFLCVLYAVFWQKVSPHGPLEELLRAVTRKAAPRSTDA